MIKLSPPQTESSSALIFSWLMKGRICDLQTNPSWCKGVKIRLSSPKPDLIREQWKHTQYYLLFGIYLHLTWTMVIQEFHFNVITRPNFSMFHLPLNSGWCSLPVLHMRACVLRKVTVLHKEMLRDYSLTKLIYDCFASTKKTSIAKMFSLMIK